MARLKVFPNEVQKTQEVQNQQTYIALQNIQVWSDQILAQKDVDYKQTSTNNNAQLSNLTTSSTSYLDIPNFIFNFMPKNTLCFVGFNLTLQGTGYIAILINGQILEEIPFLNGTFAQVTFSAFEEFAIGNNKISLAWRSTAGTLTLGCSKGTPFYNRFQCIDFNS